MLFSRGTKTIRPTTQTRPRACELRGRAEAEPREQRRLGGAGPPGRAKSHPFARVHFYRGGVGWGGDGGWMEVWTEPQGFEGFEGLEGFHLKDSAICIGVLFRLVSLKVDGSGLDGVYFIYQGHRFSKRPPMFLFLLPFARLH